MCRLNSPCNCTARLGVACIVSSKINDTIAKLLAFQSGNLCAFPGCVQKLAILQNNLWGGSILGEMAHICGEKPGAERYDSNMKDEDRNGLDNELKVCAARSRRRRPHVRIQPEGVSRHRDVSM